MLKKGAYIHQLTTIFLLTSFVLAQTDDSSSDAVAKFYAGGGLGLTIIVPTAHVQFGISDIIADNTELRLSFEGSPLLPHIKLVTDFLYTPATTGTGFYLGAGPRLWFIDGTRGLASSPDEGWYFDWSLGGLGGLRFPADFGHYYLELDLSYLNRDPLFGGPTPLASLRFGLTYDF